jgi:hypothetical protein
MMITCVNEGTTCRSVSESPGTGGRRGISQEVLAGLVGRTTDWLSKVENGRANLERLSVIKSLAELDGRAAVGAAVGQGEVTEPVQRPAGPAGADHAQAGLLEQVLGALVGQPAPDVTGQISMVAGVRPGPAGGRRGTAGRSCGRRPGGQEPGGSGLPVHVLGRTALGSGPDPSSFRSRPPGPVDDFLAPAATGGRVRLEPSPEGGVGAVRSPGWASARFQVIGAEAVPAGGSAHAGYPSKLGCDECY